ncbi:esterase-like activity of phytase family protein [Pseudonocardia sp.]|uniref:esterase-like activity of phytase family protein n=1 Tax=Pseudonocardia sp. TaxID=60912 RepID=UPI002F41A12E
MRAVWLVLVGLLLTACGAGQGQPSGPAPSASTRPAPGEQACSSSVRIDGFSDALDKTQFAGRFVGNLSSLAQQADGNIAALSDRSLLFTLDGRTHRPIAVVPLADEHGQRLDSEGLTIERDGTFLVSSEIEPSVRRYSRDGHLLGRVPVPDNLRVAPAGRARDNLTFEGLTEAPDGRTLTASMEAALSGDQGDLVRLQTWSRAGDGAFTPAAQYGYRVDPGLGVSEINALGDGRLLVLERGFLPGFGNTVRLYLADPRQADDVSAVVDLTGAPPARLVNRTLLADLGRCPDLGAPAKAAQANSLLDNIEGMTITGRDPMGALQLLLVSDDNQSGSQTTRLYSLTVTPR